VARNYLKETAYENSPAQVKRREARNKREREYKKKHHVKNIPAGKELDHKGFHRTGSLDRVGVTLVSRSANRRRQPPTKARGSARH
jgi:hypothetical protein